MLHTSKENLWTINALSIEELQIRCLQKTPSWYLTPFQLTYLPLHVMLIAGISSTWDLTYNDSSLALHRHFLSFNLTCMNIMDC